MRGVARAVVGLATEHLLRQRDQVAVGPAGVEPRERRGDVASRGLADDLAGGAAAERRLAGQDLAEDRAEREHVAPLVERVDLAPGLLGRHVGGRSQDAPGLGVVGFRLAPGGGDHRVAARQARRGVVDDSPARQDLRQAPVHQLHLAERADHDVRRLQVAMDHPPGVRIGRGLRHRLEDAQEPRTVRRHAPPRVQEGGERVALDQLHAEERPPVGERAQLIDRHDPRVLELAADLRLLDEPPDDLGVAPQVVAQDLDRHVAAEVGVAALQNLPHPSARDLAVDPVADRLVRLRRARTDDRPVHLARCRLAEQDPGDRADRLRDRLQDATRRDPHRRRRGLRPARQCRQHQAPRAEAARGVRGQGRPAIGAGAFRVHAALSPRWRPRACAAQPQERENRRKVTRFPREITGRAPRRGRESPPRPRPESRRSARSPRGGSRRIAGGGERRPS